MAAIAEHAIYAMLQALTDMTYILLLSTPSVSYTHNRQHYFTPSSNFLILRLVSYQLSKGRLAHVLRVRVSVN